ncbi:MAG: hypothetical protein ACREC5_03730 [Thermoplasmata archaeon]
MALLPEDTALPEEQIEAILRQHRGMLLECARLFGDPTKTALHPLVIRTALDLGLESVALLDLAEAPGASRALRIASANLSSSAAIALIDLYKTHSGIPSVPVHRTPPATPASSGA